MFNRIHIANISSGKKAFLALLTVRNATTNSTEAKPEQITKNISFRPAFDSHLEVDKRPLVLLYGWLVAKAKHIYKYGDFYLGKGFDVVHVKIQPNQLLWPHSAQNVVENVLEFVSKEEHSQQPILYHGFSVGGYLYGETLVKIHDNIGRFWQVGERIRGQILDSPVDFESIPEGFSKAVTDKAFIQKTMKGSLEQYLNLFHNSITKHYIRSQQAVVENEFNVPSLFLYSQSDKVAHPKKIQDVMQEMKSNNKDVQSVLFESSKHVSHFHKYPVEYISALNNFLAHIGLTQEEASQQKLREFKSS